MSNRRPRCPFEERNVLTAKAHKIANAVIVKETATRQWTRTLDKILLHPLAGPLILFGLLFVMFQSVFAWSEAPIGWIETGIAALSDGVASALPDGFFRSLIIEGVLAGVGSVVVFLPQILILFLFILILEVDRIYDPRGVCDGPDDGERRSVGP